MPKMTDDELVKKMRELYQQGDARGDHRDRLWDLLSNNLGRAITLAEAGVAGKGALTEIANFQADKDGGDPYIQIATFAKMKANDTLKQL
jgi:hypothetical protein